MTEKSIAVPEDSTTSVNETTLREQFMRKSWRVLNDDVQALLHLVLGLAKDQRIFLESHRAQLSWMPSSIESVHNAKKAELAEILVQYELHSRKSANEEKT